MPDDSFYCWPAEASGAQSSNGESQMISKTHRFKIRIPTKNKKKIPISVKWKVICYCQGGHLSQCVSSFYIRHTLGAPRLQHLSSSHRSPVSHWLCLLFILPPFHTQTACNFNNRFLPGHRASFLYLQWYKTGWILLEVFFPLLSAFHTVLWKHLGISPKAAQGESLGSSAAGWCRMSHDVLTREEISFWIFGSVEEQMCYTVTHPQCGGYVLNHNPDLNPYSKQKHSRACCCSAVSWFCLPLIL